MIIKDEATMFALFAFKVLMGENKMRKKFLKNLIIDLENENLNADYFPKKIGNEGTFAGISKENWNLDSFLQKMINHMIEKQKKIGFTVITPPCKINQPSHYLSLIINIDKKYIYTFDSLLNSQNNQIVLNNSETYTSWKEIKIALTNWASKNNYKYEYLVAKKAWQNTEYVMDAWCQTWSLLFQRDVLLGMDPHDICNKEVILKDKRNELINLIKTKGPTDFETELQNEYEAQLSQHEADTRMYRYKARDLIGEAEYTHFFESYS